MFRRSWYAISKESLLIKREAEINRISHYWQTAKTIMRNAIYFHVFILTRSALF